MASLQPPFIVSNSLRLCRRTRTRVVSGTLWWSKGGKARPLPAAGIGPLAWSRTATALRGSCLSRIEPTLLPKDGLGLGWARSTTEALLRERKRNTSYELSDWVGRHCHGPGPSTRQGMLLPMSEGNNSIDRPKMLGPQGVSCCCDGADDGCLCLCQ